MAMAAAQHHSAPKSAGPVSHNVPRNQNTATEATEFYAMSVDSDVVGGGRPPSLVDVRHNNNNNGCRGGRWGGTSRQAASTVA